MVTWEDLTRHPLPRESDQLMLQTAFDKALLLEHRRLEDPPRGAPPGTWAGERGPVGTPPAANPGVPPQGPLEDDPFSAPPRMRTVLSRLKGNWNCEERYRLLEERLTVLLQAMAPGGTVANLPSLLQNLRETCSQDLLIFLTESRQALEFVRGEKPADFPSYWAGATHLLEEGRTREALALVVGQANMPKEEDSEKGEESPMEEQGKTHDGEFRGGAPSSGGPRARPGTPPPR